MSKDNYDLDPVKACRETLYTSSLEIFTDIAEIELDLFFSKWFSQRNSYS